MRITFPEAAREQPSCIGVMLRSRCPAALRALQGQLPRPTDIMSLRIDNGERATLELRRRRAQRPRATSPPGCASAAGRLPELQASAPDQRLSLTRYGAHEY